MKPGPSKTLSTTSRSTTYQPPLNTVVAIHVPKLSGIQLLLMLLEVTVVGQGYHGCKLKVLVRRPHAKRLPLNFQLCVFVIQSHVRLGRQLPLLQCQPHTVDVIHVPRLFGIGLLLILLGASAVDPESHGYRVINVSVRHLHVTKLPQNFQLSVIVVRCHAGQVSQQQMCQ